MKKRHNEATHQSKNRRQLPWRRSWGVQASSTPGQNPGGDTVKGAKGSAVVYSIVKTAKANGQNPEKYLEFSLTELPFLVEAPCAEKLERLCLGM